MPYTIPCHTPYHIIDHTPYHTIDHTPYHTIHHTPYHTPYYTIHHTIHHTIPWTIPYTIPHTIPYTTHHTIHHTIPYTAHHNIPYHTIHHTIPHNNIQYHTIDLSPISLEYSSISVQLKLDFHKKFSFSPVVLAVRLAWNHWVNTHTSRPRVYIDNDIPVCVSSLSHVSLFSRMFHIAGHYAVQCGKMTKKILSFSRLKCTSYSKFVAVLCHLLPCSHEADTPSLAGA